MNDYPERWFATFVDATQPGQTAAELAFLCELFPRPQFRRLLDVGCGDGRHALELARVGYFVTAIDNNSSALQRARVRCGSDVELLERDMRSLDGLAGDYDGVLCLWATFGLFSDIENERVLRGFADRLRPGGRLVLDIYDAAYFRENSRRELTRGGHTVVEQSTVHSNRRRVQLAWPDGSTTAFDWRLYAPDELSVMAARCGLAVHQVCAGFKFDVPAKGDQPRMQLAFVKQPA